MAEIQVAEMQTATLPKCDQCGRFTVRPVVRSHSISSGSMSACFEEVLCQAHGKAAGVQRG